MSSSNTGDRGSSTTPSRPRSGEGGATASKASGGPITLVTLGDSLTAGQGEDPERGYPVRLQEALDTGGHAGSSVVNLGRSGWDSQQLIDGSDGDRGQLVSAEEAIGQAQAEGAAVIATVLVGSNDLWYLYANDDPTTATQERENLDTYRRNLQRIVSTLRGAGAQVVVGINDDQSKRPVASDGSMRQNTFPAITDREVEQMSAQARKYADVVRDVAADNGALVADFLEASFFTNPRTLNEDGNHPNARGYDEMTKIWQAALQPLL